MKILHTCIRVKDLEASVAFYRDAIGLHETVRRDFPEDEFTLVYMSDEFGTHELELTYNYGHPAYEIGDGYSHMAFGIEDLEEAHRKHKEAGYTVTDMYSISGQKPNIYFITDPDGYDVEIIRLK